MTDFNKKAYWKNRIKTQIESLFKYTSDEIRPIFDNALHIGAKKEELDNALRRIGEGYDILSFSVTKTIKKEESHE